MFKEREEEDLDESSQLGLLSQLLGPRERL